MLEVTFLKTYFCIKLCLWEGPIPCAVIAVSVVWICWAFYGRMSIMYFCGACWNGVCGNGLVSVNCSESLIPSTRQQRHVSLILVSILLLIFFLLFLLL